MKLKEIINLPLIPNLKAFKLQKLFTEPLNRKKYSKQLITNMITITDYYIILLVLINLVSTGLKLS